MRLRSLLKQVGIFSIVGLLAFSLVGCGQSKKEVLVVGLDDTFAPMGFKDENGEIVGFDIDLAKAVGEKMGKEMKFQSIDWSMKEAELN